MFKPKWRGVLFLLLFLLFSSEAIANDWADKFMFSGYAESDIRYIIEDHRGRTCGEGFRFEKNQNEVNFHLEIFPADRVRAVVDTKFRFFGFNNAENMSDLSYRGRKKVDPYNIMLDEAYLHAMGILWEGLDIKVGRMIQRWGKVDQFNPTDNLNARDFSDPLNYAAKVPNQMVEIDLYPTDWLSFNLVWVPVFKPSQLPESAPLGFAILNDSRGCFKTAPTPPLKPSQVRELADFFETLPPCLMNFLPATVSTIKPRTNLENSQFGFKANFMVDALEFSLSYYYGRFSFPIPVSAIADASTKPGSFTIVEDANIDQGLLDYDKLNIIYNAELMYPRVQVVGLDFTYTSEYVANIGIMGEVALFIPEEVIFGLRVFQDGKVLIDEKATNVPKTPFVKGTFGLDYTFTSWLYANVMYVRGFFEEFNDRYGIRNYLVAAFELKFFDDEFVIRLAGVFTPDDLTAITYPQLTWIVHPSVELIAGAMFHIGDIAASDPYDYASTPKFSQRAYGRDFAFFKAKVTW